MTFRNVYRALPARSPFSRSREGDAADVGDGREKTILATQCDIRRGVVLCRVADGRSDSSARISLRSARLRNQRDSSGRTSTRLNRVASRPLRRFEAPSASITSDQGPQARVAPLSPSPRRARQSVLLEKSADGREETARLELGSSCSAGLESEILIF